MTAIHRATLLILLCLLPPLARAAEPPNPVNGPYIVFIHYGPKTPAAIGTLPIELTRMGYSVREPEADQDKVGGPGVDFFSPDAKGEADKIADLVSKRLNLAPPLKSRLQISKNGLFQKFYLGIWLY
jgi:hypothetical protein